MKKVESEIRYCKNKKCNKALPVGYKYKYCEACRNEQAQKVKNILKGTVVVVMTSGAALIMKVTGKGKKS